jgi:hypothetical protein
MYLFQLLVFLFQYIYINYGTFYDENIIKMVKLHFKDGGTIHRTQRGTKRVILFLSGAYTLEYPLYIKKTMYDLETTYPSIMANYELICYENPTKSYFTNTDNICEYIRCLNLEIDEIEELVLFGFSAGGVVASHVVSQLDDLKCRKKIITYDTPYHVHTNVDSFKNNLVYRADFVFFRKVYYVYLDYADTKHFTDIFWNSGSPRMTQMILDVEGWTFDEFYKKTGFNFNLAKDVCVYNIYSTNDPIVCCDLIESHIKEHPVGFKLKDIKKDTFGHCSDMAFSATYLTDIIECLF